MSIRIRTLLFTLGTFILVMVTLGQLFFVTLRDRFSALEQRATLTNVERVNSAITERLRDLSAKTGDWSSWDDSYRFILDHNKEYIESNISYDALMTLNVDYMLFLDQDKNVVLGVGINQEDESVSYEVEHFVSALRKRPSLLSFPESERIANHGIIKLSETEFVLLSCRPILTSDFAGPARGAIVFARKVDDRFLDFLRETTHLSVNFTMLSDEEIRSAKTSFASPEVIELSAAKVRGQMNLNDVNGTPLLRLEVEENRKLMAEGRAAQIDILWALAGGGLSLAAVILLFLERVVFRRLENFQEQIKYVKRGQNLSYRIKSSGEDEISALSLHANEMLEDLERAMTESERLKAVAQSASTAKSQFLANMSHEVRTPLTGILGLSEVLSTSELGAEDLKNARLIYQSAEALLGVVNDILDFSKIEAGKINLSLESFDLQRELAAVVETAEIVALRREITTLVEFKNEIPPRLIGDKLRIKQVLNNLLTNSLKFTKDQGAIWILVNSVKAESIAQISISVGDCGKGIEAERLPSMFDAFCQEDSSTSRQYGGTGLGLTISRQLVHAMGGEISIRSRPNIGTVVTVVLPLEVEATPASEGRILSSPASVQPENYQAAAPILVAEDNRVNQRLIISLLEKRGCSYKLAANGAEAVKEFEQGQFSLILMDCQMPILDGYQACLEIREIESRRGHASRIPIVALTAHALPGDKEKCLDAGMDEHLAKPFRAAELDSLLKRFLSG